MHSSYKAKFKMFNTFTDLPGAYPHDTFEEQTCQIPADVRLNAANESSEKKKDGVKKDEDDDDALKNPYAYAPQAFNLLSTCH